MTYGKACGLVYDAAATGQPKGMYATRPMTKAAALAWIEETLRVNGEPTRPGHVFKFMSPASPFFEANMRSAIVDSSLFLTPKELFNDPFDTAVACDLGTEDERREHLREMSMRSGDDLLDDPAEFEHMLATYYQDGGFRRDTENNLARIGICSFSAEVENLLMWAYYAESHKGVALIFQMHNARAHLDAVPVRYQEEYSRITPSIRALDEMLLYGPLHKGADWKHEKEWRIVQPLEARNQFPFDWSLLWGVIHGIRCEESTKKLVAKLCIERMKLGRPPIHFYDARKVTDAYGLEFYEEIPVKRPLPIDFKKPLPIPPRIIKTPIP